MKLSKKELAFIIGGSDEGGPMPKHPEPPPLSLLIPEPEPLNGSI